MKTAVAPIPVSRNDPGFAHSVAKTLVKNDMAAIEAAICKSKNRLKLIRAKYAGNIVHEVVLRDKGSRQSWTIFAMHPMQDGGFGLVVFICSRTFTDTLMLAKFDTHAVARVIQRTVRSNAVGAVKSRLWLAARALVEMIEADNDPLQMIPLHIFMREGAFLGDYDGQIVNVKTWVSAESAANPVIRGFCNQMADNSVLVWGFPLPATRAPKVDCEQGGGFGVALVAPRSADAPQSPGPTFMVGCLPPQRPQRGKDA